MKTLAKILALLSLTLVLASPAHAAIVRLEVPGGLYGDTLPTGERAVLRAGTHVETHLGNIPLPEAERAAGGIGPLYLRVTNVGGFRFAGQSHGIGNTTWLWSDRPWKQYAQGWTRIDALAHGVSGLIFDQAGELVLANASHGSQGFRFVDAAGRILTGDETYGNGALRVSEWTEHGGLTIGQSWLGGVVSIQGSDRRIVEPGDTRFIRFHRDGDRIALAIAQFDMGRVVLLWMDVADLGTFPREHIAPDPAPEPILVIEPIVVEPKPAPSSPRLPTAVCATLTAEFAVRAPHSLWATTCKEAGDPACPLGDILNRVALAHAAEGFGVNRKDFGYFVASPAGPIASDILHRRTDNVIWDILSSNWAVQCGDGEDLKHSDDPGYWARRPWIAPVGDQLQPPPPPPPPPPPTCGYPDVRGELSTCQRDAQRLQDLYRETEEALAEEGRRADALQQELEALRNRPEPSCVAVTPSIVSRLGIKVGCRIVQP